MNIQLPVVIVQGKVVESNLDAFRLSAMEFIGGIKKDLVTDQDFVEASQNVKACSDSEKALEQVKADVINQTADIAKALGVINDVQAQLRATRLEIDKTVKQEKERRKNEVIENGLTQLKALYSSSIVSFCLGQPAKKLIDDAVKGKSSFDGMNVAIAQAVETETSRIVLLEEIYTENTNAINQVGKDFLFPDKQQLAVKSSPSEVATEISARIAKHELEEMKKAERERLEKERLEQLAQKEAEKQAEILPIPQEPAQQTKAPEPISGGVIKEPIDEYAWPDTRVSKKVSFVYNGEIDNFNEILAHLDTIFGLKYHVFEAE